MFCFTFTFSSAEKQMRFRAIDSAIHESKFTKKCMTSGRHVGQRPDCHTFLCKFWHFQMAVSQWKLAWLTPNLGILWISVSSFRLCESIVANPIIYRLVPRPSRFETRQWKTYHPFHQVCKTWMKKKSFFQELNLFFSWGMYIIMYVSSHAIQT